MLTIACSYHSILRDARHEDSLRHHFTAQNERLDTLERVVASGNLDLLERIKTPQSQHLLESPESQQLVKAPKPIEPRRLALALDDNKRHVTFDERRKRTWLWKSRVSLPLWLVNRVWEFGLREADGGWTAQLYPIMVRPQDAYVFNFVYSGDVDTVRRLLRSGQLSVRDHSQGWFGPVSLLEVGVWCSPLQMRSTDSSQMAAAYGQIKLCRFLLQESEFFHDDEILLTAFDGHMQSVAWNHWGDLGLSKRRQLVESFYHLFASENNMDVDFRVGHTYGSSLPAGWHLLLTESSVRAILNGQSIDFDSLPFEQRFSTTMKSIGWPAEIFMSIFRHDDPASLVTAISERGTTALHWAAAHLGEWVMRALEGGTYEDCSDVFESYQKLVIELIRMGANLHAIHQVEAKSYDPMYADLVREDPFGSFLRGLGNIQRNLASAVRLWGQTITEGGYSLKDYVDVENLHLADLRPICNLTHPQLCSLVSVAVNNELFLQTKLVNIQYIDIWQAYPTEIPGAWPVRSHLPEIIAWAPAEEDVTDGIRWVRVRQLMLESAPHVAELADGADAAYLVKDELREARTKGFNGVQDDHGLLAMMVARESNLNAHAHRQHVRRRSASAPPPRTSERGIEVRLETKDRQTSRVGLGHFVYSVHRCPFDGRWGFCGGIDHPDRWRWCMRGDFHNTTEAKKDTAFPYPWDWYRTWENLLLYDEDHTEIAERFAKRFLPAQLHYMQDVVRRAEERKAFKLEEEVHKRYQ
jgi:hypothetical protein